QRMDEIFPTRLDHLLIQLRHFAENGTRFDATFYDREPILDVSLNREFGRTFNTALAHWKRDKFARLLQRILLSDGTVASIEQLSVLVPMPPGGITIAMLDDADLALAEAIAGPNGETMREMIRNAYRCVSPAELDWHVRRGSRARPGDYCKRSCSHRHER